MKVTIPYSDTSIDATYYHDIDGNIFIRTGKIFINKINNYIDLIYFLSINANNDLEWINIDIDSFENMKSVEKVSKYGDIKNTYEKNSLRGKIVDDIDKQEKNHNDEEIESDEEEEEYKIKYKYYPEDKYYYSVDTDESDSDNESEHYKFHSSGDTTIIECLDRTLDVSANYDTLVFDKDIRRVLMSLESNEKNSYRVTIMTNGEIELNIIGTEKRKYSIVFDDKTIILNKLESQRII